MRLRTLAMIVVVVATISVGATFFGGTQAGSVGSGIVVEAADAPNEEYVTTDPDTGNVSIDLDRLNPGPGGAGVNEDAVTRFDRVLRITNTNDDEAYIWVTDPTDRVTFYANDGGSRQPIEGQRNEVRLAAGEELLVGFSVDTQDGTPDFDGTLTIDARVPEDDLPGTTTTGPTTTTVPTTVTTTSETTTIPSTTTTTTTSERTTTSGRTTTTERTTTERTTTTESTTTEDDDGGGGGGGGGGGEDPRIRLTDVELSGSDFEVGDTLSVTATYYNEYESTRTMTATLYVSGEQVAEETFAISRLSNRSVTFSHVLEEPGTYRVRVDDRSAGFITVSSGEDGEETTTPASTASSTPPTTGGGRTTAPAPGSTNVTTTTGPTSDPTPPSSVGTTTAPATTEQPPGGPTGTDPLAIAVIVLLVLAAVGLLAARHFDFAPSY